MDYWDVAQEAIIYKHRSDRPFRQYIVVAQASFIFGTIDILFKSSDEITLPDCSQAMVLTISETHNLKRNG